MRLNMRHNRRIRTQTRFRGESETSCIPSFADNDLAFVGIDGMGAIGKPVSLSNFKAPGVETNKVALQAGTTEQIHGWPAFPKRNRELDPAQF